MVSSILTSSGITSLPWSKTTGTAKASADTPAVLTKTRAADSVSVSPLGKALTGTAAEVFAHLGKKERALLEGIVSSGAMSAEDVAAALNEAVDAAIASRSKDSGLRAADTRTVSIPTAHSDTYGLRYAGAESAGASKERDALMKALDDKKKQLDDKREKLHDDFSNQNSVINKSIESIFDEYDKIGEDMGKGRAEYLKALNSRPPSDEIEVNTINPDGSVNSPMFPNEAYKAWQASFKDNMKKFDENGKKLNAECEKSKALFEDYSKKSDEITKEYDKLFKEYDKVFKRS
jgi:hypothetical protein